jgi:hypothetical protein
LSKASGFDAFLPKPTKRSPTVARLPDVFTSSITMMVVASSIRLIKSSISWITLAALGRRAEELEDEEDEDEELALS